MKRKKKITKKESGAFEPKKDIYDLIDDMAYINENENIQKSKNFLDSMYLLDQ